MAFNTKKHVLDQINKLKSKKIISEASVSICCPFHQEKTPSCKINLKENLFKSGRKIPVGMFKCFGCGEKGGWNTLAKKAGLKTIGNDSSSDVERYYPRFLSDEDSNSQPTFNSTKDLAEYFQVQTLLPLQRGTTWRSLPAELVSQTGALQGISLYNKRRYLVLPCYVNGELVGGFKAVFHKESKDDLSFLNTKGQWIKNLGLFPFDLVRKLFPSSKTVVLVEGQRDALNLINNGIPALCICGTNNFTAEKLDFLLAAGYENIVLMMDGDKAGKQAEAYIKELILESRSCKLHVVKLRVILKKINVEREERGEEPLLKIDPMELPVKYINSLKSLIQRLEHG